MLTINNVIIGSHSGKKYTIECESDDNILQSGLRFGINLRYECSNGTCGACKAQLKSGSITKIAHHDYKIPANELADNTFLMCCNAPKSDIEVYTQLQSEIIQIPIQKVAAKVKSVRFLTDSDIAILTLRMPRSQNLQFIAGQEAVLSSGNITSIDYPIASCPCSRMELEFHIRNSDYDDFSQALFNKKIKEKSKINITGPRGIFRLNENCSRDITFIAWDIGFAPIRSIIEHSYDLDLDKKTTFYWAYPQVENKPYFHKYAQSWCEIFDDYQYQFIACDFDRYADNDCDLVAQNIYAALDMTKVVNTNIYLAAPAHIVINLAELLLAAGVDNDKIIAFPI